MAYICGCIPARIQHALAELPETLDETYERTLGEINRADWELAHRLFQFVAVASRPLRVEELAELFAFDFKAVPIPEFHEGWRLEDPVDAVLSACSSLLAIVDVKGSPVIQFSHFSVKEFLTSARLAESSNIFHRRYHISMTPAHTLALQACLGTLVHLDEDVITPDSLEDYPLAEYAAEHWVYHAQFEDLEKLQNVEDGMKQLFDPSKPHLAICIWIHNPEHRWKRRSERPSPTPRSHLHYAAFWGLHSIVHFLVIEHSQDVHSRSVTDDKTPLDIASGNGHKQVACLLLEHGADISGQDKYGKTPLHRASQEGHVEVALVLIKHGADVSARDMDGKTPLHVASQQGHVEVAHMLIERNADISDQDVDGRTPIHLASGRGRVEVVHMLIEHGADASSHDKDGETPLHLAFHWGSGAMIRTLIECVADISAQGKGGKTPLHLAMRGGYKTFVHMLIERGADISTQDSDGETLLHLALRGGYMEMAHMFIERGADISAQGKDGKTPLHLALHGGYTPFVHMLIERGADILTQDSDGETLLHLALRGGYMKMAQIFIERGADVLAQGKDGKTPLQLALRWGYAAVIHMLIERGADF